MNKELSYYLKMIDDKNKEIEAFYKTCKPVLPINQNDRATRQQAVKLYMELSELILMAYKQTKLN